jgi:hypothetical protein
MRMVRTSRAVLALAAVVAGLAAAGPAAAVGLAASTAVIAKPTVLKIAAASRVTAAGKYHERVTGVLVAGKTPLAGRPVELEARPGSRAAWKPFQHAVTAAKTGTVAFAFVQRGHVEQYRLVFAGGGGYGASVSAVATVRRG